MGAFKTLAFLAGLGTGTAPADTAQQAVADAHQAAPVDLAQVDALVVTGGGVAATIGTDPSRPLSATLDRTEGCDATMRVEGRRLIVDIREENWRWPRDCRPSLSVNLRPGTDVTLRPAALSAALDGRFGAVAVDSEAAEVSLAGRVWTLDLSAKALKATIRNTSPDPGQAIRIDGKAVDVDLGFRRGTPVTYAVDAKVSMVESTVPVSAGGRPSVSVTGKFVRARIGYID